MDPSVLHAIRSLLDSVRVLTAAVLVDGEPVAALLPFAVGPHHTVVYVHASGLARHTRGLQSGVAISLAIHAPDAPERDPLQLPRLTVQAEVTPLERSTPAFTVAAERLRARFPSAAMTLDLADFTVFELRLGRGRYVEGFARAFNVGTDTFAALGG